MRDLRNPFRLRRTESIDRDSDFLALFEPGVLDALNGALPSTFQPLRSASGGGKTAILRLFRPRVLRRLHQQRNEHAVEDLYNKLRGLEVFSDAGPVLLGVPLQCGRNYAVLEHVEGGELSRTRLLFSLLNSRIVLATLKSALELAGLSYPADVPALRLELEPGEAEMFPGFPNDGAGGAIYEWARGTEEEVCAGLDSFGPIRCERLPGHDGLHSLGMIRPERVIVNGAPVAQRILFLMDDVHQLSPVQREVLLDRATQERGAAAIWIAERFEALSTSELLSSGSKSGRDHNRPIDVERYWRRHFKKFEGYVMSLADRRVEASSETELKAFGPCLAERIEGADWDRRLLEASSSVRERLQNIASTSSRFSKWVEARSDQGGGVYENLVSLRSCEILIERERGKVQRSLFDDVEPLEPDDLEKRDDANVRNAAELFLSREFGLPYYFGVSRVARLSSLNIQQFLGIGASLLDEVVASETLNSSAGPLSAQRQHELLKQDAEQMWQDIPNSVRDGRALRQLLESVGRFARWYTYRKTAPNDPGVAGTAIRMSERQLLLDEETLSRRPDYRRLAGLLGAALAHNYLIADVDYKCKGERWMVLNLNRMLCVKFDLPLGYGLYKERPLDTLCAWVDKPFSEPRQEELL